MWKPNEEVIKTIFKFLKYKKNNEKNTQKDLSKVKIKF